MRTVICAALLFLSGFALAQKNCTYSLNEKNKKFTFTGYKFTEKLGVNGSFDKITFAQKKNAKSIKELFESVSFQVDTNSLNTKNPARDKTIKTNFFQKMFSPNSISGKVTSFSGKSATANLKLNGKSRPVKFSVTTSGSWYKFKSSIDVLDFSMKKSFDSIHNSCKALHTGKDGKSKTWSEVGLLAEVELVKNCK